MPNDDLNPNGGTRNEKENSRETPPPQGSPASIPTSNPDDKTGNRNKPRLFIRIWRIYRKRQQRVSPPNVAAKITVFLILVTAAIGGVQARIYYQQKKITESSGQQTQRLIDAANIQACAAQKIADASDRSAAAAKSFSLSAEGIETKTGEAVTQFQHLSSASQHAADTARDTLVIGQRPWIGPELAPTASLKASANEIRPFLVIAIKNYGLSPALYVSHRMAVQADPKTDVQKVQDGFCQLAESAVITKEHVPDQSYGIPMFPNGPMRIVDSSNAWKANEIDHDTVIIGCIAYVDQFHNSPTHSPIHHTRFCFRNWQLIKDTIAAQDHSIAPATFIPCFFANDAD